MKFKRVSFSKAQVALEQQAKTRPMFTIVNNGFDVLINRPINGDWMGYTFTQLKDDYEGRKLLRWVTGGDFDEEIRRIATEILIGA
jgi:hypothetical protein